MSEGQKTGKRLHGQAAHREQCPSGDHGLQDADRKISCGKRQTASQESTSKEREERGTEDPIVQVWCSLGLFQEGRTKGFRCKPSLENKRKPGT